MRRQQLQLKKKITFEEWRTQKDREIKKDNDKWGMPTIEKCVSRGQKRISTVVKNFKKGADAILENQKEQIKLIPPSFCKKEESELDNIIQDPKKPTFREWLHNKNSMIRDKMRMKRLEREEKERQALEREKMVKRAYDTWLIQSKYRCLRKYYPKLGEDEIHTILTNDFQKLGLMAASKNVGVGDASVAVNFCSGELQT